MQQMESAKKQQVNKSLNNPYRHRGDPLHVDEHPSAQMYQTQDDNTLQRMQQHLQKDPISAGLPPQPSQRKTADNFYKGAAAAKASHRGTNNKTTAQ